MEMINKKPNKIATSTEQNNIIAAVMPLTMILC